MQFVNPVTGGPVFPTLDYCAQLLRPGEELDLKRETCSTFVVVMDGPRVHRDRRTALRLGKERHHGDSELPVAPSRQHRKQDAVLYTVSDAALLRAIGQYRSQGKHRDGKVVQIVQ